MNKISKKELCAGSIYYFCLIYNVDVVNLKEEAILETFNKLNKLDYDQVYKLFNDLKSKYKNNRSNKDGK